MVNCGTSWAAATDAIANQDTPTLSPIRLCIRGRMLLNLRPTGPAARAPRPKPPLVRQ